jgi:hypothetical protein
MRISSNSPSDQLLKRLSDMIATANRVIAATSGQFGGVSVLNVRGPSGGMYAPHGSHQAGPSGYNQQQQQQQMGQMGQMGPGGYGL